MKQTDKKVFKKLPTVEQMYKRWKRNHCKKGEVLLQSEDKTFFHVRKFSFKLQDENDLEEPKCLDCGILYKDMGLDLVLPDQQWKKLCPENGILCANCICKRATKNKRSISLLAWIK